MKRTLLYIVAATISFMIGVVSNNSIDKLGGLAVEGLYHAPPMLELGPAALVTESGSGSIANLAHNCGDIVITVARDGSVYLNKEERGSLNETDRLIATLRQIFESRDVLSVYTPETNQHSPGGEYRSHERTVFIKAPREVSYGKIVDLIDAIKKSGADRIGLVAYVPIRTQ